MTLIKNFYLPSKISIEHDVQQKNEPFRVSIEIRQLAKHKRIEISKNSTTFIPGIRALKVGVLYFRGRKFQI